MWKVAAAVGLVTGLAHGQADPTSLLSQPRHIEGLIIGRNGNPLMHAWIDDTGEGRHVHETDSQGRFAFDTRAPKLVARKAGFRSELLRTEDAKGVRVTLRALDTPAFRGCSNKQQLSLKGWGASFRFPKILAVKASPQTQDVDYAIRWYWIYTQNGPTGIRHGSGPSWSFGAPKDRDVWQSTKFEEFAFQSGNFTVIDARGILPNGNRWRYLGRLGESADYSDVDTATEKFLTRF